MYNCETLLVILLLWGLFDAYSMEYFNCSGLGNRISKTELCNGHVDCSSDGSDSSDESVALCLPQQQCKDDEYRCAYGACIPLALKCNGLFDCADHSDETRFLCCHNTMDVLQQIQGDCADAEEAQCANGDCIDYMNLCDGIADCADSSDESVEMCGHINCPPYSYRCGYGGCIPHTLVCNGIVDCADASDELKLICALKRKQSPARAVEMKTMPATSAPSVATCAIPYSTPLMRITYEHNGLPLELQERIQLHMAVRFECLQGTELTGPARLVCTGSEWYKEWPQCVSALSHPSNMRFSPRIFEAAEELQHCTATQWQCALSGECIGNAALCDGVKDCSDGTDETVMQCITHECAQPTQYRCAYGACIAASAVCNGQWDCADGSDEAPLLCIKDVQQYTQQLQRHCVDPWMVACDSGECIAEELLCDGAPDCGDGSDETSQRCAHIECPAYVFRCGYGACVSNDAVCDGVAQCADGSDELAAVCAVAEADAIAMAERTNADGYEDFIDFHIDEFEAKNALYNIIDNYDDYEEQEQEQEEAEKKIDDSATIAAAAQPAMLLSSAMIYRKCFIPLDRLHLNAVAEGVNATLRAGSHVGPETLVDFSCDEMWWLTDGNTETLCMQNGEWSSPPPRCEKKCDSAALQVGISTIANCYYNETRIDCEEMVKVGTVAALQCSYGYTRSLSSSGNKSMDATTITNTSEAMQSSAISCDADGEWNAPKLKCYPECTEAIVINGSAAATEVGTNVPYNASIFHRSNVIRTSWLFGCFGTIVSPKFVITGALCFSINPTPDSVANDPLLHNVCIGMCGDKYDQNEASASPSYKLHNISEILIAQTVDENIDVPALVVLVDYIVMTVNVKPICLNFIAYNCRGKRPKTWTKQQSLNATANTLGVGHLGAQQCLVFVGETTLEIVDYFKDWLHTQLSRYDYLL